MRVLRKAHLCAALIALILVSVLGMAADVSARTTIFPPPPPGGDDDNEDNGDPGQGERAVSVLIFVVPTNLHCSVMDYGSFMFICEEADSGPVLPLLMIPSVSPSMISLSRLDVMNGKPITGRVRY